MKKRVNIITVVVLMALTGLVTFIVTFNQVRESYNDRLETFRKWQNEWRPFTDALNHIENKFVGETEQYILMQGAISGMVRSTDRWAYYYDPEAFRERLSGTASYVGIGVDIEREDGKFRVTGVKEDSPSDGLLEPGDLLTHVNGLSIAEIGYDEAIAIIRGGELFSLVTLTVERPGEGRGAFDVGVERHTIIRERIVAETVSTPDGDVGVVKILNFDDNMDTELIEKTNGLIESGVIGLVFDVRNNSGGKLNVMVAVLDYLLPEGGLITLRDKNGDIDTYTSGPECIELPMAVLINGGSVSAAEFFAACLREYDWAVLVGEESYGKGVAQETIRLNDGSGISISTSKYFISKDEYKCLDGCGGSPAGLKPDVEIILSDEERRHAGSMDPNLDRQLARALEEVRRR
jgi:carboxyl-terminal processing protease